MGGGTRTRRTRTERAASVDAGGVHAGFAHPTFRREAALGRGLTRGHAQAALTDGGRAAEATVGVRGAFGAADGVHADLTARAFAVGLALRAGAVVGLADPRLTTIPGTAGGVAGAGDVARAV